MKAVAVMGTDPAPAESGTGGVLEACSEAATAANAPIDVSDGPRWDGRDGSWCMGTAAALGAEAGHGPQLTGAER